MGPRLGGSAGGLGCEIVERTTQRCGDSGGLHTPHRPKPRHPTDLHPHDDDQGICTRGWADSPACSLCMLPCACQGPAEILAITRMPTSWCPTCTFSFEILGATNQRGALHFPPGCARGSHSGTRSFIPSDFPFDVSPAISRLSLFPSAFRIACTFRTWFKAPGVSHAQQFSAVFSVLISSPALAGISGDNHLHCLPR